jgi:hypothetical protein
MKIRFASFMLVSDSFARKQALHKIASVLMQYLERIVERLESYYKDHAALNLYNPNQEANPARARWNILRRRIHDGSFFLLTHQIKVTGDLTNSTPVRPWGIRNKRETVNFDQVLSQAVSSIAISEKQQQKAQIAKHGPEGRGEGLAAAHAQRAGVANSSSSTYEEQSVYSYANTLHLSSPTKKNISGTVPANECLNSWNHE